MFIYKDNN